MGNQRYCALDREPLAARRCPPLCIPIIQLRLSRFLKSEDIRPGLGFLWRVGCIVPGFGMSRNLFRPPRVHPCDRCIVLSLTCSNKLPLQVLEPQERVFISRSRPRDTLPRTCPRYSTILWMVPAVILLMSIENSIRLRNDPLTQSLESTFPRFRT